MYRSILLTLVVSFLAGCAKAPPTPEHAIMPSAYIDNMPVKRVQDDEEVYVSPESLIVDENSRVWLKADAPRIKEPSSSGERCVKVFKQGGEYLVITCNIVSFSVTPKSELEGCKAPEKLRVAKVVVKTSVNDLASLKFPAKDDPQVKADVKDQVAANRRGL